MDLFKIKKENLKDKKHLKKIFFFGESILENDAWEYKGEACGF